MAELKWSHHYSVGVKHINLQHMRLLELINRVERAAVENCSAGELSVHLVSFVDYCQNHFRDEEELLELAGYPSLEFSEHKVQHESICCEIFELNERLVKDEPGIKEQLRAFLGKWLVEHILKCDKSFSECVKDFAEFKPSRR